MPRKARGRTTKKDVFIADGGKVLTNLQIIEFFRKTMLPAMPKGIIYPEILFRIGDRRKPIDLSLNVYSDTRGGGSVYPVNLAEFAQKAITEMQNYRMVDHLNGRGVYKVLEKMSNEPGIYVLTNEREPRFKIGISQTSWIVGPMTFEDFEGVGTFKYSANFDERPKRIIMKTSVVQRVENPGETLVRKLFLDFHTKLKRKHRDSGMTLKK